MIEFELQEVEIIYKPKNVVGLEKIKSSHDAYYILKNVYPSISYREHFYILLLNNDNKVLGYKLISMGGLTSTIVDIRVIMQTALKANAVALILSHNHPSGTLKPSQADKNITKKIKRAGEVLDIKVLDHIIVTEHSYFSFADEMLM